LVIEGWQAKLEGKFASEFMYQPPRNIIILLMMILILLLGCEPSFKREDILSTEEKENSTLSVKITAFRERRDFGQVLAGAYYVFEVKNREEQGWRKFMTIKYDDPIPIDKNSIVLINERIGYVFMIEKFAVTTDAGFTWSIWDISKVPSLKDDLSCRIQSVRIVENGTGSMNIKCNAVEKRLSTNDYGITWQ
jgi:hypothetical protein